MGIILIILSPLGGWVVEGMGINENKRGGGVCHVSFCAVKYMICLLCKNHKNRFIDK